MKKSIVIALATAGFAMGALAQGSIAGLNTGNQYITTGAGNYNISTPAASANSYYSGALSLEVFFSDSATVNEINAINALNGTQGGGGAALALLTGVTDGFQEVSLVGANGTQVGAVTGTAASPNASQLNGFPGTVNLSTAFTSQTVGDIALYFIGAGGVSTAEVIAGNYGGNSSAQGAAFIVTAGMNAFSGQNQNIDMTPTPEPSSMALAGLGGIGMMLLAFRRKQAKA